jgi:predicted transcriptional regulator
LFKAQDKSIPFLGPLESELMELVWRHGAGNVHDVAEWLQRTLAYTTVMTTLDRLYKKGLLLREKRERAFVYSPRLSRVEWEEGIARDFVAGFRSHDLLISCLVNAVSGQDAALLDELEKKIRLKRKELGGRK